MCDKVVFCTTKCLLSLITTGTPNYRQPTEGGCRESPGEGPDVGDSADSVSCWGFPEQSYK
jgi:hypothetical protein